MARALRDACGKRIFEQFIIWLRFQLWPFVIICLEARFIRTPSNRFQNEMWEKVTIVFGNCPGSFRLKRRRMVELSDLLVRFVQCYSLQEVQRASLRQHGQMFRIRGKLHQLNTGLKFESG